MAKKKRELPNHWPPFVDCLSTVVIVLTFLVVIIGLALFYITQKINENTVRAVLKELQSEGKSGASSLQTEIVSAILEHMATSTGKPAAEEDALSQSDTPADSTAEAQASDQQGSEASTAQAGATSGETPEKAEEKSALDIKMDRQETPGGSKDGTEAKVVDDPAQITFTPAERESEGAKINVEGNNLLLTIDFPSQETSLTEEAISRVDAFLESRRDVITAHRSEIRAAARSPVGSVSEARRIAYYRALSVRNRLIKYGVPPDQISIKLVDNVDNKDFNKVSVSLLPPDPSAPR